MRNFLPQRPVPRALVDSSYGSNGYFFGSFGATDLFILLLLFLVFMMYLRSNSTSRNVDVIVKPKAACQILPSFPGWVFESSTALGVGAKATYTCTSPDGCVIFDETTCDAQSGWRPLSACNANNDCNII